MPNRGLDLRQPDLPNLGVLLSERWNESSANIDKQCVVIQSLFLCVQNDIKMVSYFTVRNNVDLYLKTHYFM